MTLNYSKKTKKNFTTNTNPPIVLLRLVNFFVVQILKFNVIFVGEILEIFLS